MAQDIEKKLDRYYDDLMGKLLELVDLNGRILTEHKELKKEISKLREVTLQTQTVVESAAEKMKSVGRPALGTPEPGSSNHSAPTATPKPGGATYRNDYFSNCSSMLDVKVLNAFIKSSKDVIKSNSGREPNFQRPRIEDKMVCPIVVAGRMKLTREGGKQGAMAVGFEKASGEALTREVFRLPPDGPVSEADMKDVTSEICNQICGKSKIFLKNEGYIFEINNVEVHAGTSQDLFKILGHPRIILLFDYISNPFHLMFWD